MDQTSPSSVSVVIADADPAVLWFLKHQLGPYFSIVAKASNADEAIQLCESHTPDAAIVDVEMPDGGGARAAREIRERSPSTAIIAYSVAQRSDRVLDMLAAGAMTYVRNDAPQEQIVRKVHQAVAVHRHAA